eukprot:405737-Rhodomonas_salina.1
MKWTRASKLITEGGAVVGVEYDVYTAKEQTKPQSSGKCVFNPAFRISILGLTSIDRYSARDAKRSYAGSSGSRFGLE